MREGATASGALDRLRSGDGGEARRQVAFVDASSGVAVFTGSGCVAEAGDVTGDGVSAQAKLEPGETP